MKAMILPHLGPLHEGESRLVLTEFPVPEPKENEILVRVSACGVCHTELDEIEGRTPPPALPVIPGHQIIGRVEVVGANVSLFQVNDRVGIGWIYSSCGKCHYCLSGNDNLCPHFLATGRDVNGGYAEYITVPAGSAHAVPEIFSDAEAAPLLCAGAIGYRSLRLTGLQNGQTLGLTGFGASAHIVLQMAQHLFPDSPVFVFARNEAERKFARELGAVWAGDTEDQPPQKIDCIIDTTPAWKPILSALTNLRPAGRLVINAIRKEEKDKQQLLKLDYPDHLWLEKEIKSVANVSRTDIHEFLQLAAAIPLRAETQQFRLDDANSALNELKARKIRGAKVLIISN